MITGGRSPPESFVIPTSQPLSSCLIYSLNGLADLTMQLQRYPVIDFQCDELSH